MLVMETFAGTLRDTGVPQEEQDRFASNYLAAIARLGGGLVNDPLHSEAREKARGHTGKPRQRYVLDDTGFNEVPKKYRKFYRRFGGQSDTLAPNEVLCPVCMVVVRSSRELRPGDRVYCMPCFSRLVVVEANGRLEAKPVY